MTKPLYAVDEGTDIEPYNRAKLPENTERFFTEEILPQIDEHFAAARTGGRPDRYIKQYLPVCVDHGAHADHSHIKNNPHFNEIVQREGVKNIDIGGNMNKGWAYLRVDFE